MSRWGLGVVAAAALAGCGGTVDLRSEGSAGSIGKTGVAGSGGGGDSFHVGGSTGPGPAEAAAGSGTGPTLDPKKVTPGPVVDAATPSVVDDGVTLGTGEPTSGVYAFDANRDGAGRALYLSSLGTPDCALRLTSPAAQAKQPVFSPDRQHLAYAAWTAGTYQIHVLNLQSGVVEQVTNVPEGATAPSYSPDGQRLAFLTGNSDAPGLGPVEGVFDVTVLDLAQRTQRVILRSTEQSCCAPSARAPTFFNDSEVALSTGTELIAINIETFSVRQVMPISGRIPNPQDPSPGPDGVRYAYVDRCQGALSVFIGRVDGSSGDSCVGATRVPVDFEAIGTDWGPHGYIATARKDVYGVVLIDDQSYEILEPTNAAGGNNPAWAPAQLSLALDCE